MSASYRREAILLGNGVSISIAPTFSYGSLLAHARENKLARQAAGSRWLPSPTFYRGQVTRPCP
ncbi:DUF4917 family protein [Pseudomonas sp. p1(2021b)]|uniref:DUF4917 family protein n=1 Tax=Pseudomonas sp. p1(2021b) TaxID=2874628 RepID=UPI001CCE5A1E|nr:DUF4917 family protein [Pseudomonas sp. p1(2021b)]UBM25247.1 DUF4917 family protein [Pseudomonas sp. p1(2021b)]